MSPYTSLLACVLLASTACAAPTTLADRVLARRAARLAHDPSPFIPATGDFQHPETNGTFEVQYSDNWSGTVWTAPPAGTTFSAIAGTFNVPTPKPPPGKSSSGSYAASAWVGIDGDTYQKAIAQAGCDFTYDDGVSYDCWYEWYPNPLTYFSNFNVNAGDQVKVTVTAESSSKAVAVLTDETTGQSVSKTFSAPSSSSTLGGKNAEWIVEDFESGGGLVPFADFGSVTFTGCAATAGSQTLGTSGSTAIEIENSNGQVITSVSYPSSNSVEITYE